MNFNHQQNKGGQLQQPHPQQQAQQNAFPALPPQLANLTPQQLQQLRNQPQFQALMKNYMQRQQMMNQQAQIQGQTPTSTFMNSQSMQPSQQFNQQAPLQHQHTQQAQQAPTMQGNIAMPPRQPSMGAPNTQAQGMTMPQQIPNHLPQQMMRPGIPPNSGMGSGSASPHVIAQQMIGTAQGVPVPEKGVASNTQNELINKIPLKELSSTHEWSEKLQKEGKDIPIDLKVYESIIGKDAEFLRKKSTQVADSKKMLDSLVKDIKTYSEIKQLRMNAITLSSKGQFNNSIWGEGYQGYGNGITNTATRLLLPHHNKRHSAVPDIMLTEREINERVLKRLSPNQSQQLVPIRLEFDQERDKFKLRDTFLWDLNEDVLPLENFVALLIDDYKFIPPHHAQTILSSIREQIRDFHRKPDKVMGELRVPIKIDVTINNTQLVDQFEWDILNFGESDPEDFARIMCDEMNLPGEFTTAVAHTIREQTQLFHKSLFLVGYSFDGSPVYEDEIRSHVLPSLRLLSHDNSAGFDSMVDDFFSILRNPATVPDYTPSLVKLTQLELERLDKEIERDSRRKRRHNLNDLTDSPASGSLTGRGTSSRRSALHMGRGGPVLPDLSDAPKTFRTPAPSSILPGGIDLGVPDMYGYNEVIVHRSQIKNPDYKPPPPPSEVETNTDGASNRVRYTNDRITGRFLVSIKLRT
ncbi:uncharacterized protein AC631_00416 [Debaryomyces fabryi]|uniref:SWI/SNF chromatin-remodeling complex subunit SNF5 n=1 Tax=Debaryomyces fabryi TaxID=58627 RepID=A0A0V1Q662_9ASCO|nr:uncharacterized protein AC631_00416 [Debaryomyces fabryi]KSA03781.1 hypothetical protein AC631_00416 [Debaryomyces fabryi]CUM45299.1 unnamed protein product [Debaryomyces fabryi]